VVLRTPYVINGGGGYEIQPQPMPMPTYEQIPVPESITDLTLLQHYINLIYSTINDLQVRYSVETDPLVKQNLYNLLQFYNELLVRYKNRYNYLVQQQQQQYLQQQQATPTTPATPTVTYNRVTYRLVVNKRITVTASVLTGYKAVVEAELKYDLTPIINKGGRLVGGKFVFDLEVPSATTLISEYYYRVIFNNYTVHSVSSTTKTRDHVEVDVPLESGLNQGRIEFGIGVLGGIGGVGLVSSITWAVINPTLIVVADIPSNIDLNQLDNELKEANNRLVSVPTPTTPPATPTTPTPTTTPTTDIFQSIIQLLNYLPVIFIILLIIEIIKATRR